MEYIYASLILHKAGKEITEDAVKKVLVAAGVTPDEARVKALIASLEGVDIKKAIETQAVMAAPVAAAPAEAKKDSKPAKVEEEKKSDEQAAAGLGALFG